MQETWDVIVAGGGNAGLSAAISAASKGRRVLLIERGDEASRGGNSKYTRDIRYAHDHDAITTGRYSEAEFLEDLLGVTLGKTNLELAKFVIKESFGVKEFMEDNGVLWQKPLKGTLHLARTNAFFLGGGKALVNAYYARAQKLGVKVMYSAAVQDAVIEEDTFRSVVVQSGDKTQTIIGKALVA
ncbi:MAG: FAD-dependent oxidoreductase, partial [Nitrososphaerota archaeon]|nr:FAD-dependent oxidoreductase [Nitrososphaerota archaeon]